MLLPFVPSAGPAVSSAPVAPAMTVGPAVLAPAAGAGVIAPMAPPLPPPPTVTAPPNALDRWRAILDTFTAIRPVSATADGQLVPDTTMGDVRRAALRFSRMLCAPCYDSAHLGDTRAAWRDALARVQEYAAAVPWGALYPDNAGWWLGDTRALAQRLAAIDDRRNGVVQHPGGAITITGGRLDPLVTYLDLRGYFLARRLSRTAGGWRYPETTVRDATEVVRIVNEDVNATILRLPPDYTAEWLLDGRLDAWRRAARVVLDAGRGLAPDAIHPQNALLWTEYRKVSIPLSVARTATFAAPGASS